MKSYRDKYKFYNFKNENGGTTVVAVSHYEGKQVKSYAKCDSSEPFNQEKGEELALARCNLKIANKRIARAARKYKEAKADAEKAYAYFEKMKQYYMDSVDQADEYAAHLAELEKNYK